MGAELAATFESVRRATAGDAQAFGELVDQYSGMVTGVAYSVLGDFSRSEDAGQEAFLCAWKQRKELTDPSKFASWVCAIARNRAIDMLRRSKRQTEATSSVTECEPAVDSMSVESEESESRRLLVWESLDNLPENYRESMVLFYRSGQSVAEVAASLDESESTIRKRLERGRKLLRSEVEQMIENTLRGTAPKAVFTAGVLAGLSGTAQAASTAAAFSTAKVAGTKSTAVAAATGISGGLLGTVFGVLGGIGGGVIGTYAAYQSTPYKKQRRLILRSSAIAIAEMGIFFLLLGWLISGQTGDAPLPANAYAIRLVSLIVGFQLMLAATIGVTIWMMRRAGDEAKSKGEDVEPSFGKRWTASRPRSRTSKLQIAGLPLFQYYAAGYDETGRPIDRRWAKAWIAIGDKAISPLLAFGGVAIAPIAFGGITAGLISIGGLALGAVAIAGLAIGGFSFGGGAIGYLAIGGGAAGFHAGGGLAAGVDAIGGAAFGLRHAFGGNVAAGGPMAPELEWLKQVMDSVMPWMAISRLWPIILVFVAVQLLVNRLAAPAAKPVIDENESEAADLS